MTHYYSLRLVNIPGVSKINDYFQIIVLLLTHNMFIVFVQV